MYSGFRDDVGVEAVAQVDGVDIVTVDKGSAWLGIRLALWVIS